MNSQIKPKITVAEKDFQSINYKIDHILSITRFFDVVLWWIHKCYLGL